MMILPPRVPELVDLDLLLCVERLGSLSKAARAHAVSQPTASVRIQALERRLGLRLLERTHTGCQLTPAGQMVAQWARGVIEAAAKLAAGSAVLRDVQDGRLRVMASPTVADHLMPGWLVELRERLPLIAVEVRLENTNHIVEQLTAGQIDLGFVEDPCGHAELAEAIVGRDELVVVVAPTHPWAGRTTPMTVHELAAGTLVLGEPGSGTRDTIEQALGGLSEEHPYLQLGSTNAIKGAVAAGAGVAVLSLISIQHELRAGALVRVPTTGLDLVRKLRAAWRRNDELPAVAQLLVTIASRGIRQPRHRHDRHVSPRPLVQVDAA